MGDYFNILRGNYNVRPQHHSPRYHDEHEDYHHERPHREHRRRRRRSYRSPDRYSEYQAPPTSSYQTSPGARAPQPYAFQPHEFPSLSAAYGHIRHPFHPPSPSLYERPDTYYEYDSTLPYYKSGHRFHMPLYKQHNAVPLSSRVHAPPVIHPMATAIPSRPADPADNTVYSVGLEFELKLKARSGFGLTLDAPGPAFAAACVSAHNRWVCLVHSNVRSTRKLTSATLLGPRQMLPKLQTNGGSCYQYCPKHLREMVIRKGRVVEVNGRHK